MILFARKQKTMMSQVGEGCQWEGNLQAQGYLQIDGLVRGLVTVNGDIKVSETGLVEAVEIRGRNITVQGVVKAHVYAEGKLTLGATARIEGNVIAGAIAVSPGAYYTGHLATYDSRTPFYKVSASGVPTLDAPTLKEPTLEGSDVPVQDSFVSSF